jgi:hypothetical protein
LIKEKFNPSELFDEITKSDFDPSIFDKLDERGIPKAPNIVEWATSPQFLHTTILPKQIEIAAKLLGDYCPDCSNPGYIDSLFDQSLGHIRDNVCFLEHGVCPKCKSTRGSLVAEKKLGHYNELVGCLGQRSGKTKLVGLVASYQLHRFLKIPDPLRFFGLPSGELLMGTFSALTAEQCRDTLWESFKGFVDASPWFQNYHNFLKNESKQLGVELFRHLTSYMWYGHKHILFHYTGSEARKMRGKTRILCAIDELGWMNSEDSASTFLNADAVYTALSNSLATMKMKYLQQWDTSNFDTPPALMLNISSPSAAKDKIMRLLKQAKDSPRMLAFQSPTWETNPDYSFESLREEFSTMTDLEFYRDFGAEPPIAADPYLADSKVIDRVCQHDPKPLFEIQSVIGTDGLGDEFKSGQLRLINHDRSTPRMLCFDLGYKKNALAFCLFSIAPDSKIQLDYCFEASPTKNRPVNGVHFFENVTSALVKNFNIKFAFFDRWQSMDQVQRLKDMGVDAKMYSLTYKDMDNVRGAILSQGVSLPKLDRPVSEIIKEWISEDNLQHLGATAGLAIQLLTVRDFGTKMMKPLDGDDDIFRAFCLGVVKMQDPTIKVYFQQAPQMLKSGQSVSSFACVRTRGGNFSNTGGLNPGMQQQGYGNQIATVRTRSKGKQ